MNYKISVIMPIYNAEKDLKNSIQSVINQSIGFNNIQLILIDDCSNDNSKNIIKTYDENYDNIATYFSEKNHGTPGFGRNMGLKLVESDYIMFIDSDDYYDKDICKNLYEAITSENADVACCNKINNDIDNNTQLNITNKKMNLNKKIITNDDILLVKGSALWNKIYKKEIIDNNNLKFIENTVADDLSFNIDYYLKSKKMIILNNYYGYYWTIRSDSISHKVPKEQILRFLYAYTYTYNQLVDANKEQYYNKIIQGHVTYLIGLCSYLKLDKKEFKKVLNEVYAFEKNVGFDLKLNNKLWETTNRLILSKHFETTILFFKLINCLRKSTLLQKIIKK
jgi:glycosyltransferase involved in cell wall biosynthesis